jgi:hypothetical protein
MARKLFLLFIAVGCVAISSAQLAAQTWAEKLGYPDGSRVVILSGREAGISWEMNVACRQLLEQGKLSSVDAVVTGPWFESFAAWCKNHPNHDVGVSFALINPYAAPQWPLLTSDQSATTLVDAKGAPWKTDVQLLAQVHPEDVKNELDAQIQRAKAAGITPTHLGTFTGAAFSRFDLTAVFLGAAKKYWIPASVVELTPEMIERFKAEGFPLDERMVQMISQYPLPKLDDLKVVPAAETYEMKVAAYCELLQDLAPGLTQVVHLPAVESIGLELMHGGDQHRAWQLRLLNDPAVAKVMADEKLIVTSWREIMRRFEGKPIGPEASPTADGQE